MTRSDFIAHWRDRLAGTIALGAPKIRKELSGDFIHAPALGRAIQEIGDTTDQFLGEMWDWIQEERRKAQEAAKKNGEKAGVK